MTFEKVEIGIWKPKKENDQIEGILLKSEKNVGSNNSMLYTLEVDNMPTGVWGSAVLDPKMFACKIGNLVRVVYLGKGEAQGGHEAPKLFDVYIDRPEESNEPIPEEDIF